MMLFDDKFSLGGLKHVDYLEWVKHVIPARLISDKNDACTKSSLVQKNCLISLQTVAILNRICVYVESVYSTKICER